MTDPTGGTRGIEGKDVIRISRPCYDKAHRCPGWAGAGMRYARARRCDNGRIPRAAPGRERWWPWLPHRCDTCRIVVLPSHVRWVDPAWLKYRVGRALRR